jgi:hypothetical protein
MGEKLQVHIAGAKRAGKTSLADNVALALSRIDDGELSAVVLDVDRMRIEKFGGMHGAPGSEESLKEHSETMRWIFDLLIPQSIDNNVVPVTVAGHSSRYWFDEAKRISTEKQTKLKFLVLRPPTLEEAARRGAEADGDHQTDMQDFDDPVVQEEFKKSVEKIEETYGALQDPSLTRIDQGSKEQMTLQALQFILDRPGLTLEEVTKLLSTSAKR